MVTVLQCVSVTEEWRKLHNEWLHGLCRSSNNIGDQFKENKMGRARGTHGGEETFLSETFGEEVGRMFLLRDFHINSLGRRIS